jgi:gas vesicle protein
LIFFYFFLEENLMSENCKQEHTQYRNDYTKGMIIGAFFGGVAGAITALLLAPKSGREIRQDIAEKSSEYYNKASNVIKTVEENYAPIISDTINEGKAKAQSIIDIAKSKANNLINEADKVIQDARAKTTVAKDAITDKYETLRDATKAGVDAFKNEYES